MTKIKKNIVIKKKVILKPATANWLKYDGTKVIINIEHNTKKYWLFWSHRGYMEYKVFKTEKAARRKITRYMKVYEFPILIKGTEISLK